MKHAKSLVPLLAAFVSSTAFSQSNVKPLDSIVIQENRWQSPLANHNRDVQIITNAQIKALPVKSIPELLSYTSGVDIRQRGPWGSQADISIDGSTFDQVAVLLNGVKVSDPQTGHNMLNLPIPLSAIDHIEIIRGAASAVYGVNALAGVVNIVTKIADATSVAASVYGGSSFENDTSNGRMYAGWGAQASAALHTGKLGQQLSVSHDGSNGYRYNTANRSYKIYYQNELAINRKVTLSASGGYVNNDFGASLFYAAPKDVEATENVQTATAALSLVYKPIESWNISARGSLRYNKDNYIFIRQAPEVYHNIHETSVSSAEVQATKTLAHGHFGVGLEGRKEEIHSNSLGSRSRNNTGAYLEYGHSFGARFSAGVNLYFNNNTDYGSKLYPALDLGYRIAQNWKLFANGGMSQRLPTYTDLYYKGPTNIGNDLLRPEEAIYGEGGIRYSVATQRLTLRYACRSVTDFIDWVRNDVQEAWQPQNFGQMNMQVVNASGSQSLGALFKLHTDNHLWLDASWTYLHPERGYTDSKFAKYTTDALSNQVIIGLRADIQNRLSASVNGRYLQRINSGDYTLVDVHLQYNTGSWQVFADVNNLLDTEYSEVGTVPLPGRWVAAGLRFKGLL